MESPILTPSEFDTHLAHKTLRLSFVGMSNCGKSYRSRVLERENDFFWYQVDDDIAKTLEMRDVTEVGEWMGFPTDPTYPEREATYIELENKFTGQAAMSAHDKNLVFDTTGSVIHLDENVLAQLRENTLVVHLDVGEESLEALVAKFLEHPKPVAWSGYFSQEPSDTREEALRRSFPLLLKERMRRYRALAHVALPATSVRDKTGLETLALVRERL